MPCLEEAVLTAQLVHQQVKGLALFGDLFIVDYQNITVLGKLFHVTV
jgi:hypothetical protein